MTKLKVVKVESLEKGQLFAYDSKLNVLKISLDSSQWNGLPNADNLMKVLHAYLWTKLTKDRNFSMSRSELERFMHAKTPEAKAHRAALKAKRTAEKHANKGLTEEECLRRKMEAMKKK